jgi:polyferredoxin|tara:strand:- start:3212 stop:3595 length:384 start_codon:yes stop_codon:yes gene_type:complete
VKRLKIPSNRNFGLVFFFVFFIISIWPLFNNGRINIFLVFLSFIFLLLGLVNSKLLMPLNKLWFSFGLLLGRFISPIIMGVIFFGLVTPIGLLLRVFRKDILKLKLNNKNTYWDKKNNLKNNFKNQF